jgi:hypothetical protein
VHDLPVESIIRLELLPPFGVAKDRSTDDYTAGWLKFSNRLKSMVEFGNSWQEVQLRAGQCRGSFAAPATVRSSSRHAACSIAMMASRCLFSTSSVVRSSGAQDTFASVTAKLDPVNLAGPDPRSLRESSAVKRAAVKQQVECLPQAEKPGETLFGFCANDRSALVILN